MQFPHDIAELARQGNEYFLRNKHLTGLGKSPMRQAVEDDRRIRHQLRNRTACEWTEALTKVPERNRAAVACLIFWDYCQYWHQADGEAWQRDYTDAWEYDGLSTKEELITGLWLAGYSPFQAEERVPNNAYTFSPEDNDCPAAIVATAAC